MATNRNTTFNGLEIDFLGLPMVFNDGQTVNTLAISVTNNNFSGSLQTDQNNIVLTRNTPISVWFVADVAQASAAPMRNWALTSYDALHDAKVSLSATPGNWDVRRSDDLSGNPLNDSLNGWQLTAQEDLTLLPGHSLTLTLSGFTSAEPDGSTSAYCQVQLPEPGADGKSQFITKVIGPITKSRVMIKGERMGIGTGSPNSALEVNGYVAATGGVSAYDGFTFDEMSFAIWGLRGDRGKEGSIEKMSFFVDGATAVHMRRDLNGGGQNSTFIDGDLTIQRDSNYSGGNVIVRGDIQCDGLIQDKTGILMPVGAIIAYGGSTPPPGWLMCDGSKVPQGQEYNGLRSITGDFLPDLTKRIIAGASVDFTVGRGFYVPGRTSNAVGGLIGDPVLSYYALNFIIKY